MSQPLSLADQAVIALSAVARIASEVTNDHDERHAVRSIKRMAQLTLEEAFRRAEELAYLAADLQRTGEAQRAARSSCNGEPK